MLGRVPIRWRRLPDGESRDAAEVGRDGRFLEIAAAGGDAVYPAGSLVEIEYDSLVYMGEVLQNRDQTAIVLVEHSIDVVKAAAAREVWS